MDKKQISRLTSTFDEISHSTDDGVEFWFARELQKSLGYARWENFEVAIKRAMEACANSGFPPEDQFRDVTKLIEHGKTGKERSQTLCLRAKLVT